MCVFGFSESTGLHANDLHVLFVPLMTFYGLALVLVMWSRLEINMPLRPARLHLRCIYLISALPFLDQFLICSARRPRACAWPPYIPPYIAIMNGWTTREGNHRLRHAVGRGVVCRSQEPLAAASR